MEIEKLYAEALGLLTMMIACPSHSREESVLADKLCKYLQERGQYPERVGNNLWLQSPDLDPLKPTYLLNSHIDTVRPVSAWTMDPYCPQIEGGKLFGLGSNDAGASLVCLLAAFNYLSQQERTYNLIFLASCEEEISGAGGLSLVLPLLPPISLAIVGEPTGMCPAVAEKGLMVLDCLLRGVAGHAAREEGQNAIYKAVDSINWFKNYRFPLQSPWLGSVKMSVTMIQAGTQHNVVPDECRFVVDVRTNELYSNEEIFEQISNLCGCDDVRARSFRLNSSSIDSSHPMVLAAKVLGKMPFGSPTLSDQTLMPFPSIKIGVGLSERSHTANEFVFIDEIREGIELYIKLIKDSMDSHH